MRLPLLLVALPGLLVALFFFQHPSPCCAARDTLSRGHALTGGERLVSQNGKFALGFFQTGSKSSSPDSTLNSYLGIWFYKVSELTPVWSANGANPIPVVAGGPAASQELAISADGNLVVLAHGTIIWATRSNISAAANSTVAVLLGNGNLVLRSSTNSSQVFWQSFDYPTDTLLSGAKLGRDRITGLDRRIVSRKSSIDQAPGPYSNELGLDRTMRLSWWNSSAAEYYWSSGEWNGRFFDSIPEMSGGDLSNLTLVSDDREVCFSYALLRPDTAFQVLLDVSGQWTIRVWNAHEWVTFARYPKYQCDVHAACGAFSVCSNNAYPPCDCMKGFSAASPEDYWELEDRTGGCIRNTPLNYCGGSSDKNVTITAGMADGFYSMPSVRLPGNGIAVLNATNAQACAQVCLGNCSCTAYSYGRGGCSVWHGQLLNVAADDDNGEVLYLRLAAKEVRKSNRHEMVITICVTVAVAIATLSLLLFLTMLIRRHRRKRFSHTTDADEGTIGIAAFRHADMKRATKNFTEKLGAGSFGSVFKGRLNGLGAIAVKRLADGACQGDKQFRAEVSSIGMIQHINLVKLIGFCCEGDRRLLVYEYMPNGSLDSHLFESRRQGVVLRWNTRYQIALGVARGLAYLHHGCRDCIIHCDVKPQNILLDSSFIPKVADFGMAKFLGRDFSRAMTTMRGTIGYLAPEWISGTAITSKVDVYSYGMVLLEIISGRRNSGKGISSNEEDHAKYYFPLQVVDNLLLNKDVRSLVDANLQGDVNLDEVERACKVACWCIQDNEFDRPTMTEVVQFLEGISQPDMPPMPRWLHAITVGPPYST